MASTSTKPAVSSENENILGGEKESNKYSISNIRKDRIAASHGPTIGKRHIQSLMLAVLHLLLNCIKHSMAICVVAMTDPTANTNKDIQTFEWTNRNILISSYIWGFTIPQIASGWIVTRYGPKWFTVGSMTFSSLFGLMTPLAAVSFGSEGVLVCRVLQGILQALLPSATYVLMSKWFPSSERSRSTSFVLTGTSAGAVVSMFLSGFLAASSYGWPMIFYFYNGLGLIWAFLFCFIGHNCPANHPTISEEEKRFIESSLSSGSKSKLSTPWTKILTSGCFWALVSAHCAFFWGLYTLISVTPLYFKYLMKFNIKKNGLWSSLPLLTKWILSYAFAFLSDFLINRHFLSTGKTRKVMTVVGMMIPCIALLLLGNTGVDEVEKSIVLLVIAVGFTSANYSGLIVNYLDISPNHSGTIYGISSQVALMLAAVGPLTVDFFVVDKENPEQWKYVFYLSAGIYTFATLLFVIFGSGKVQTWNSETRKGQNLEITVDEGNEVLDKLLQNQVKAKKNEIV